jgi:SAM-dependent methyltransferase
LKKIKAKPYEKLALVYDHLMNHVNYDLWTKYIFKIIKDLVSSDAGILELAGGNGKFSNIFKKYYPNILVTDKSIEMLLNKQSSFPKVCCEMISLPFKKKFDLIYSTFDSVNYLIKEKDLLKLFTEVRKILNDDGIFTFDVSLERNSELFVANHEKGGKDNNVEYDHISIYNKHSKIHRNIFELRMKDGTIYKEVHKQKIYPFPVYFNLLNEAGMFVLNCYEAFSFREAKENSKRVQFIVKRN